MLAGTPASPLGTATRVTNVIGTAQYNIAQQWAASGRGGYIHTDYIDNTRRDDAWTIGGTLTYRLVQNIGLTLDYQHVDLSSNVVAQSFSRDIVTVGMTFKY